MEVRMRWLLQQIAIDVILGQMSIFRRIRFQVGTCDALNFLAGFNPELSMAYSGITIPKKTSTF